MLEQIMVPTDASAESERAMPIAEQLAAAQNTEALLVQVAQYPAGIVSPEVYQQILDATAEEAAANLDRLAAHFEAQGIRVTPTLLRGSPAACLLDFEREHNPGLVVMATHGRTGLARFALGSTTDRMVREGTSPVVVVRNASLGTSLKTVLLTLDGSVVAEEAVPVVEALAGHPVQTVKLFRVVEDPVDRTAAATYLEGVGARLNATGLKTEISVELGDPTPLIGRAAQQADLVVLCTHGRGGIDRFRHGSVAERVVREAEKPVLLVRAGMSLPIAREPGARSAGGTSTR